MVFQIERTSIGSSSDELPCKNCFPIKLPTKYGTLDRWGIEINSLEELINLMEEINEPLIVSHAFGSEDMLCIEIYDDYRE